MNYKDLEYHNKYEWGYEFGYHQSDGQLVDVTISENTGHTVNMKDITALDLEALKQALKMFEGVRE